MSLRKFFSAAFHMESIGYSQKPPDASHGESFSFFEMPPMGFEGAYTKTITVPTMFFAFYSLFEGFLQTVTGISSMDYQSQISFLQKLDSRTRKALKNIFIGDEKLLLFLRIMHHLEEYGVPRIGCGCLDLRQGQNSICVGDSNCGDLDCPMRAISILHSYSET